MSEKWHETQAKIWSLEPISCFGYTWDRHDILSWGTSCKQNMWYFQVDVYPFICWVVQMIGKHIISPFQSAIGIWNPSPKADMNLTILIFNIMINGESSKNYCCKNQWNQNMGFYIPLKSDRSKWCYRDACQISVQYNCSGCCSGLLKNSVLTAYSMWFHYSTVYFLQNMHHRHPLTHPGGKDMVLLMSSNFIMGVPTLLNTA